MTTNRILLVEDDNNLAEQAMQMLQKESYEPLRVQIEYAMEFSEWQSYGITPRDLVVLDLNFKIAGVKYSGKDVLKVLENGKQRGILPGLEKILIATSMKAEVDPRQVSPDIAFIDERIKMYGLEKGVNQTTRMVDSQGYAVSLLAAIHEIYQGQRSILNSA